MAMNDRVFFLDVVRPNLFSVCSTCVSKLWFIQNQYLWHDILQFNAFAEVAVMILGEQDYFSAVSNNVYEMLEAVPNCVERALKILQSIPSRFDTIYDPFISNSCSILTILIKSVVSNCFPKILSEISLLKVYEAAFDYWVDAFRANFESACAQNILLLLVVTMESFGDSYITYFAENLFTKRFFNNEWSIPWCFIIEKVCSAIDDLKCEKVQSRRASTIMSKRKWRKKVRSFVYNGQPTKRSFIDQNGTNTLSNFYIILKPTCSLIMKKISNSDKSIIMSGLRTSLEIAISRSLVIYYQVPNSEKLTEVIGTDVGDDKFTAAVWALFTAILGDQFLRDDFLGTLFPPVVHSRLSSSSGCNIAGLIHQLMSVALNNGFVEPVRWLSLNVCVRCLLSSTSVSPSMKLSSSQFLTKFLETKLQETINGSIREHEVYHGLLGLFMLISANPDFLYNSELSNRTSTSNSLKRNSSFLDLISWIYEKYKQHEIFVTLLRFMGFPFISSKPVKTHLINNCFLGIVMAAIEENDNTIKVLGCVVLLSIVQQNEKIKALIRSAPNKFDYQLVISTEFPQYFRVHNNISLLLRDIQ